MLKCLIYLMNFQNFKTEILHVQHNENRATWIFHQLKKSMKLSLTFLSELGSWVVRMSLSVALCLRWTAATPDEDLGIQKQTLNERHLKGQILFPYFDIILQYKMILLTTGGSLLSLLPSDVLLSEPQEVGEYSLFWAEEQQGILEKGIVLLLPLCPWIILDRQTFLISCQWELMRTSRPNLALYNSFNFLTINDNIFTKLKEVILERFLY